MKNLLTILAALALAAAAHAQTNGALTLPTQPAANTLWKLITWPSKQIYSNGEWYARSGQLLTWRIIDRATTEPDVLEWEQYLVFACNAYGVTLPADVATVYAAVDAAAQKETTDQWRAIWITQDAQRLKVLFDWLKERGSTFDGAQFRTNVVPVRVYRRP